MEYRALCQRNGSDSGGHGSQELNMALTAEFLRDQPRQYHDHAHSNCREGPKTNERRPEEDQFEAGKERSDWRIHHKTPVEMASVIEGLQFVAVESILAIGRDV